MVEVWEVVNEYDLLNATSRDIEHDGTKRAVLAGVMQRIGQPIKDMGCLICLSDSLKFLKSLHRQKELTEMAKATTKYKLKSDRRIPFGGQMVDNSILTDELAAEMLKNQPWLKDHFEKIPESKTTKKAE